MSFYSTNLIELCYVSEIAKPLGQQNLINLINGARAWNDRHEITSVLFYVNGRFGQVMEGSMRNIDLACRRISRSTRHHRIRHLETRQINMRAAMGHPLKFYGESATNRLFPELSKSLCGQDYDKAILIRLLRLAADQCNSEHRQYLEGLIMSANKDDLINSQSTPETI
jgi:hypothetical protein